MEKGHSKCKENIEKVDLISTKTMLIIVITPKSAIQILGHDMVIPLVLYLSTDHRFLNGISGLVTWLYAAIWLKLKDVVIG